MKAIVALPTILLIGGIIVEIAVAGVFIAYLLSQSGFGAKLSAEALAAAQAGIQEAMMKIVRDKNFSSSGYDIAVGSRAAHIIVCKDSKTVSSVCSTANSGKENLTIILGIKISFLPPDGADTSSMLAFFMMIKLGGI